MVRRFSLAAALVVACCPWGRLMAASRGDLIPETTAARHGLTRPWYTQVQMDRTRTRLADIVLCEGTLYAQTDRAMVHAIDAETGQTRWAKQVGRPDHPSLPPAAHGNLLAVVNGSRLYVCNRYTGDLLYEVLIDAAPSAGPALSSLRAYIPTISGSLLAYPLEPVIDSREEHGNADEKTEGVQAQVPGEDRHKDLRLKQGFDRPLSCRSAGRALVEPLVTRGLLTEELVVWATDRGYLNVGRMELLAQGHLALKYRVETGEAIAARPAYLPPDPNEVGDSGTIFAASRDGYLYAIQEETGEVRWRFSTGEPILEPAVVIDETVYVASQLGGMFCLSAEAGTLVWWAPQARRFVAASKQRVYAADGLGRISVLSAETGARLDTIAAGHLPIKLGNLDTDRLYLATETGLIQCLRERELPAPIHHGEARRKKVEPSDPAIQQTPIEEAGPPGVPDAGEEEPPTPDGGLFD